MSDLLCQPLQIFVLCQTAQAINEQDFIDRMRLHPIRNRLPFEIPQVNQVDRAIFLGEERGKRMRIGILHHQKPFVTLRVGFNMNARMIAAQKNRVFIHLIQIVPKQHPLLHDRLATVAVVYAGYRLQIRIDP